MKKFRSLILIFAVVVTTSCNLELQEDPNAIRLDQINPTLLLNKVQVDFAAFFNAASTFGMHYTRMQNSGQADYENTNRPTAFDNLWTLAYSNVLNDIHVLLPIADQQGLTRHAGIARAIQAYTLLTLVDYFGDVPFSQAFQGLGNLNPGVDDMEDLYDVAIATLNQALTNFNTAPNPTGVAVFDFYYGGAAGSWIRFINSVKLKAFLNLRTFDQVRAAAGINEVLAHPGGVIQAQTQNFVFRYATNTADPDSRHPRYINNYLTGAGDYMANYYMWQMNFGYNIQDPRMRFYFYRQTTANNTNPNNIRCILESIPSHYPTVAGTTVIPNATAGFPPGIDQASTNGAWSRTFCFPTGSGYWGRDHIDPQGIPPDGLLRTTWGGYPAGGRFDANNGLAVTNATTLANSMRGAGFQPIMMRSFVSFMLAEADEFLALGAGSFDGTTVEGGVAALFEKGIRFSMQDVRDWCINGTFGSNGFGASPTQAATINAFAGYDATAYGTTVNTYVASALAAFGSPNNSDNRMNHIAREYWVSLFGNGIESYNMYRRTGTPTGMQPAISPTPGKFPRTLWYPVVFEARNSSVVQKTDLTGQVFWDTNTANLDF